MGHGRNVTGTHNTIGISIMFGSENTLNRALEEKMINKQALWNWTVLKDS